MSPVVQNSLDIHPTVFYSVSILCSIEELLTGGIAVIGILGAVDSEIGLLVDNLRGKTTQTIDGITFYKGLLRGHRVAIGASGVAKVNAARATQVLIDKLHVSRIIFNGSAGGLAPGLRVGNLVVSTTTQQYDVNFTAIGYPKGVIPYLRTSIFPANKAMISAAKRGAAALNLLRVARFGKIVTGETFVTSPLVAKRLYRNFNGLCVETEGGATGQVCYLSHVPYLVIRGISDIPGKQVTEAGTRLAERRAQRLTMATLARLPQKPAAGL